MKMKHMKNNIAKRLFIFIFFLHTKRNVLNHKDTVLHVRFASSSPYTGRAYPIFGVPFSPCNYTVIWKLRLPIESQIQLDMWGKMSDLLSCFYQAPFISLADITLTTFLEQFQTTFNRTITSLICNNSLLFSQQICWSTLFLSIKCM